MIHHITAICSDTERTTKFYTEVLGLRLVKVTVNQDDVGTYHLYFGDKVGSPGTALTFFHWPTLPRGVVGRGMVGAVAFAVSPSSMAFWKKRLSDLKTEARLEKRFGGEIVQFRDPDGLALEIVGDGEAGNWSSEGVPVEHSIRGFYGATLMVENHLDTGKILAEHLGYKLKANEGTLYRYSSESAVIDLYESPQAPPATSGVGTVHHIAFRAADEEVQRKVREKIGAEGLAPTPVIDRYYFKSVYFREPNGILFEIATDGPGFTVDEPEETLGSKLVLPPRLESQRKKIEKLLPKFNFPR